MLKLRSLFLQPMKADRRLQWFQATVRVTRFETITSLLECINISDAMNSLRARPHSALSLLLRPMLILTASGSDARSIFRRVAEFTGAHASRRFSMNFSPKSPNHARG